MESSQPDGLKLYNFQKEGKFCDLDIVLAGKHYPVHKVKVAAESKFLLTGLNEEWQHQRKTRDERRDHSVPELPQLGREAPNFDILLSSGRPGQQTVEIDLPFLDSDAEKHATFDTIVEYIYLKKLPADKLSADYWSVLIQAADFLIIDDLFEALIAYFKKHFTNPAEPSTDILLLYQQCAKYDFLFSLSEHTCQFIKANLNRIIYCMRMRAEEEIGCSAQDDGGGEYLPSEAELDKFIRAPPNIPPELQAEMMADACDDYGSPLRRVQLSTEVVYMTEAQYAEHIRPRPVVLEQEIDRESCSQLEPEDYDESELIHICSRLHYTTIENILAQGSTFSPRVGDLDVFFLIIAWAGSHQEPVPKLSARRALRSNTQRQERFRIPYRILKRACNLLQRFMVKNMNDGERTVNRLRREKKQRGKHDFDIFQHYIDQSPTKTPAKHFSRKFFTDELEKYHPISKVWKSKGEGSYSEFEGNCYELFQAWLKLGDSSCLENAYGIEPVKTFHMNDIAHEDHIVPFPSARKRKASQSIECDLYDEYTDMEVRSPRVPYQAPLVVGSWCGKNEQDADYGPSSDMHVWDDSRNLWTKNPNGLSLPTKLCYNGRAFLEPYLYIFGGYDGQRSNSTGMNNAYKINIETLECKPIAPLKVKRLYITGCTLGDDSVVALGGSSNKKASLIKRYVEETGDTSFINDTGRMCVVEQYIVKEDRWRRLPNMRSCRSDASACSYKDIVYVAGGFDGKECLNTVEMYVRDFHQWTDLPTMKHRRSGLSLVVYQGNLLALCGFGGKQQKDENGENKKGRHKTVECLPLDRSTQKYNHKTHENWRVLSAELQEGRSNFGACVLNDNQIVVCGGFNTGTLKSCERWHGTLEEVKSLAYPKFEKVQPTRGYKKDGWHRVEDLPIEMSAMSVVTISSTSRPLTGLLRAKENESERPDEFEMAIATPRTPTRR